MNHDRDRGGTPARPQPLPASDRTLVTILTSNFGGGHMSVARTVAQALAAIRPHWRVEVLDFFETFVGSSVNKLLGGAYTGSARKAPYLYGGVYALAQWVGERRSLQAQLNRVGRDRMLRYLRDHSPDVLVSTYPTPAAVISALKLDGQVDIPSLTILTDFAPHSQWINQGTDVYIVGTEEVARGLTGAGVPGSRVQPTGIPVGPGFRRRGACPPDGPVLITVGAQGMLREATALCRAIIERAPRTVVICGHDAALEHDLSPLGRALGDRVEIHGFVDDMHRHYARACMLVGKPGGLTVAEALATGLPMVVFAPIPGHEAANARFLLEAGAARSAETVGAARDVVMHLLSRPAELAEMAARAAALGKPNAARAAAEAVVALGEAEAS